jgi:hypothetical protein
MLSAFQLQMFFAVPHFLVPLCRWSPIGWKAEVRNYNTSGTSQSYFAVVAFFLHTSNLPEIRI